MRLMNKSNVIKCLFGNFGNKYFSISNKSDLVGENSDDVRFEEMEIHALKFD